MDPNQLLTEAGSASSGLLLWGMLFSSLGIGFFIYGKRQGRAIPLLTGIGLSVLPFVTSSQSLLIGLGSALTLLPYFWRTR